MNVFVIIDTKHVNFKKTQQIKKIIVYVKNRVYVNKAHQKEFATNEIIFVFKCINKHVQK